METITRTTLPRSSKIKRFYENLYKQTEPANVNRKMKTHRLSDEIYPTLTDDKRAESDKEITVAELTHALSVLNKDSAPSSSVPDNAQLRVYYAQI